LWLQWDMNRRASESVDGVVLHAGAVASARGAILLPGFSGAGKSTITALLTRAGFGYLTDEAVVIGSPHGMLDPYPKPLSLGQEAIALLGLTADLPDPFPDGAEEKQLVPARLLRERCLAGTCAPVGVALFSRGGGPNFEPVSSAALVVELAAHSSGFENRPRRTVQVLAAFARGVEACRFRAGDSAGIAELVSRHFGP
jgi:hypothetical protein